MRVTEIVEQSQSAHHAGEASVFRNQITVVVDAVLFAEAGSQAGGQMIVDAVSEIHRGGLHVVFAEPGIGIHLEAFRTAGHQIDHARQRFWSDQTGTGTTRNIDPACPRALILSRPWALESEETAARRRSLRW